MTSQLQMNLTKLTAQMQSATNCLSSSLVINIFLLPGAEQAQVLSLVDTSSGVSVTTTCYTGSSIQPVTS